MTQLIKPDTTYNTTNDTLRILHTIQYLQFSFFRLHTYVPSKLEFRTGFHLALSL